MMWISRYEDVSLREFEEKDIPKKVEWINNPENNRFLHYDLPLTVEGTTRWFQNKDNSQRLDCVIEYEGKPVGVIGLLNIDQINRKAEYYITVGDTSQKGKGIGYKATEAILDYAFSKLYLHKVYLTVDTRNETAKKLYKKSGFRCEGIFQDDLYSERTLGFINRERYAAFENSRGGGSEILIFEMKRESFYQRDRYFNTPIQDLGEFEGNHLYIKRDDLIPFSFGGNKARKAAHFFSEIDRGNYDCIVTYGSSSSNHCRIISNLAAACRLPCIIISPQEVSKSTFNRRMMEQYQAKIIEVPVEEVHDTIERTLACFREEGKNLFFIPGGGHGNFGTQAYVDCYQEIKNFEENNGIIFDVIYFASGTGTTQAGLICGQLFHQDRRSVRGISIARKNPYGRNVVVNSIQEYINCQQIQKEANENTIFLDDYTDSGYGHNNLEIENCIYSVLENYGIPLDPTYTGKAFSGMSQDIEKTGIDGKNILFIHTGGTPLFFDFINSDL